MFYDAHIHRKNKESGGFLIGTEGEPELEDTLNNEKVLALHAPENMYVSFYYVTKVECCLEKVGWKYLKYHPRREQYTPEQVIRSVRLNTPEAVIIDTLNEPYWQPYDYWTIARQFPEVPFVFAHSGGYLINEFIKICHFQSNVWIDFSYTHTLLGKLGGKVIGLPYINQAIEYSLNAPFGNRVLLGSDFPFCNQDDVFGYYERYIDNLNSNFTVLFNKINI